MKVVESHEALPLDNYKEDYFELLQLMQIPDIRKIIFRRLARLKDEFSEVIDTFPFREVGTLHEVEEGKIIRLHPNGYFPVEAREDDEFLAFLEENQRIKELFLREFGAIYKQLYTMKKSEPKVFQGVQGGGFSKKPPWSPKAT